MTLRLVDLDAAHRAHKRRLLEEARRVVTDIRDARAKRAFRQTYESCAEADETLVDLDAIFDGAETR